jgi:hypothetical protein
VAYHVQAADATYGANQSARMSYSYHGFRIAPFRFSWNIPGHMLSAAIAYQVLQQENPPTTRLVWRNIPGTDFYLVNIGNENECAKTRKNDKSFDSQMIAARSK